MIIKKTKRKKALLLCTLITSAAVFMQFKYVSAADLTDKSEIYNELGKIFTCRSNAILAQDIGYIDSLYDKNTRFGVWACEHEVRKVKYIRNWSEKQGIKFIEIKPILSVKSIKNWRSHYSIYLVCSTEYKYKYEDGSKDVNSFRIGTYHSIQMVNINGKWLITKEWYTDPFEDSLNLDNIKYEAIKQHILTQTPRDFSTLSQRRLNAVSYAYKYSGAANDSASRFSYNKKYSDFNPLGGDCANFASQILHEGGKFQKTSGWNYDGRTGNRGWLNAQGFKDYWLWSGNASKVAYGNYEKVFKASYNLNPGDFIAYEKNGKVTHISVVTGADSKGYTLVNCHNSDRHRVPWDLGWSNKNIRFWLIRVHF